MHALGTWGYMMQLRRAMLTVGVLVGALGAQVASAIADKATPDTPDIPYKAAVFKCTPRRLHPGDTLTIRVSVPHGSELGVWDPSGQFMFLSFWQSPGDEPPSPLDYEGLAQKGAIVLPVDGAVACPVGDGFGPAERVFAKRGWYHFLLGKNLETENNRHTVNSCRVFFIGRDTSDQVPNNRMNPAGGGLAAD